MSQTGDYNKKVIEFKKRYNAFVKYNEAEELIYVYLNGLLITIAPEDIEEDMEEQIKMIDHIKNNTIEFIK